MLGSVRDFKKFPWGIYFRLLITQFLVFGFIFGAYSLVVFFEKSLSPRDAIWMAAFSFMILLFSAVTSYFFCLPISHVIHKALIMSSRRKARELGPLQDDLFEEDYGEYSDLEHALNRIERKLKNAHLKLQNDQEELRALLGGLQEGLISINLEGQILFYNSKFAAQLKINSSQLSHLKINSFDTDSSRMAPLYMSDIFRSPEIFEAYDQVRSSQEILRFPLTLEDEDSGGMRIYSVSFSPLRRGPDGVLSAIVGVFHDITEIKRAEQIRIDFFGNASHELRTPVTTIKGYVETLREDIQKERYDACLKFIEVIARNTDRLVSLLNDMLEVHQLENNAQIHRQLLKTRDVTEEVVGDLAILAKEKNQKIEIRIQNPEVYADRDYLIQVLRNLVQNSIKYIQQNKLIEIVWRQGPNGEAILSVIDNGPGIAEPHLARIFERFYRVDQGRSRDLGGTGLGLSIVKHVMQCHGGTVAVKSRVGFGCEFTCTFLGNAASLYKPYNLE